MGPIVGVRAAHFRGPQPTDRSLTRTDDLRYSELPAAWQRDLTDHSLVEVGTSRTWISQTPEGMRRSSHYWFFPPDGNKILYDRYSPQNIWAACRGRLGAPPPPNRLQELPIRAAVL